MTELWVLLAAGSLTLTACQEQRAPSPRARASAAPASRTLAAKPTPATPDPALAAAIAADRANEFQKLSLFLSFAKAARKAPDKVSGIAECKDGEGSGAGVCSKIYAEPGWSDTWLVSYVKSQVEAFRVQAVFGNVELACSDLGVSSVVRSWQLGSARKQLCALSAGPLSGLQAIIENYPGNSRVLGFSKAYLEHDPGFNAVVELEGANDPTSGGESGPR